MLQSDCVNKDLPKPGNERNLRNTSSPELPKPKRYLPRLLQQMPRYAIRWKKRTTSESSHQHPPPWREEPNGWSIRQAFQRTRTRLQQERTIYSHRANKELQIDEKDGNPEASRGTRGLLDGEIEDNHPQRTKRPPQLPIQQSNPCNLQLINRTTTFFRICKPESNYMTSN